MSLRLIVFRILQKNIGDSSWLIKAYYIKLKLKLYHTPIWLIVEKMGDKKCLSFQPIVIFNNIDLIVFHI